MAATFDGFSIRDYTSKMRSIDVFKCWPFTSSIKRDVTREEVQSWLPPMTVPEFRCPRSNHDAQNHEDNPSVSEVSRTDDDNCSEESAKSDNFSPPSPSPPPVEEEEKLEMVCPVCREFNAATLTAVNAHIDGCLAQTMRDERRHMRIMNFKASSKSKAPKKRSIAEIFKVEEEEEQPRMESVLKLWPFREDGDDEVSITVRKFRWLSRRLEALRSKRGGGESAKSDGGNAAEEEEEKLEMVCPVCRDFNAATVTAVNAHIDGCLAQAVREERRQTRRNGFKPKPKAPKKRSIAEILTVAPRIEASENKGKSKAIEVEEDEDKSSDYDGLDDSCAAAAVVSVVKSKKSTNKNRKKKKTKKVKKKKGKLEKHGDSCVSLEKKTIVSKKKKNKEKSVFNIELTGNKEGAYKRMVQTAGDSSGKLKGTIGNKMVALQDIDPSVHGKKWGLNGLSVQKKQEVENCDSVGKQQKAVSPVCGILKNHSKHVSGKTSSGCNSTQDGTEESHYNDQVLTSDKHVKFSAKDDIFGPKKRNSFDETMFNISSDALATSVVKEQSSESDEETASLVVANKNYDHIAINKDNEKRKEVCPIVESKQFANTLEQVTVQNFLKPCTNQEKSKHLEEKSELLTKMAVYDNNNLQPFDVGNTTTLHFSPYADISRPLSAFQEEQMSGINTQVCESGAFNSSVKFNDHSEDPSYQADVNKNANTKTFLDSSSSYSVSYNKANEKPECSLQTYGDNDNSGHALGDSQLPDIFSADMIDNSFPSTNWSKGRVRNGCLDPNYFGLPLNSQGELISFSSSGKVGMNQPETSSTLQGSLPINNILRHSSQENLSPNGKPVVQKAFQKDGLNPFPHHSAGLAVTELQCSEREDIHRPNSDMCPSHYVQPLNSEFLKQNSFQVQNHNGNGKVSLKEGSGHISLSSSQPTVRLMGKDVPIGRSSQEMQQFAGDVWTDEESRRRHYSEYATLENSLLGRCSNKQNSVSSSHSQISTGNVLQSAKIQSNQGLQNTILMNGRDSGFSHHFIDMQNNHMSQNGSLGVGRASSYFNPITQESTSYGVFNGAPEEFPEQFMPGAKPLGLSSRSHPCNFSQPTYSSNVELNDRNKNPHVTKSAFGFPFLQPSVNEQAKTYWFQRPYRSVPSWLSSSTDEMLPGTFSQQYSGVSNQSFPQNRWGNNFITPSVNHSAEVLFPSNPLTSRGPMTMKTTPLCSASIVQPIRVPVTPSTINSGCSRNINKVPDRVTLDGMITKDHHHPCTNSRKRPAANLDDSRKPIKLSHIEVKENLSRMTRFTGENSRVELQRNTRAVELDPQVDSARSRSCQNEVQRLNPTSYPTVDSFKLDGMVTSGPVRLGPKRAKHILKSS